jgi:ABC-type Na+ efflux pump permease subunit
MLKALCTTQLRTLLRNRSVLWISLLLPLLLHPLLAWGLGQFAWLRSDAAHQQIPLSTALQDPRVSEIGMGRILVVDGGTTEGELIEAARLARALKHGSAQRTRQSAQHGALPDDAVAQLTVAELRGSEARTARTLEFLSVAVLLLLCLAMSWPALELTIGERSSGLAETLACAPLLAGQRAHAKLASTAILGFLVLCAHAAGMTLAVVGSGVAPSIEALPWMGVLLALAGAISFVLLCGSAFLAIGAMSRELGEAHAWSWLVFVVFAASLLPLVLEEDAPALLACLPGPGHALCLQTGANGASVPLGVLVCLIVSTLLTLLFVRIVRRQLATFEMEAFPS